VEKHLRPSESLNWQRAGILSGFGQCVLSLIALTDNEERRIILKPDAK